LQCRIERNHRSLYIYTLLGSIGTFFHPVLLMHFRILIITICCFEWLPYHLRSNCNIISDVLSFHLF